MHPQDRTFEEDGQPPLPGMPSGQAHVPSDGAASAAAPTASSSAMGDLLDMSDGAPAPAVQQAAVKQGGVSGCWLVSVWSVFQIGYVFARMSVNVYAHMHSRPSFRVFCALKLCVL